MDERKLARFIGETRNVLLEEMARNAFIYGNILLLPLGRLEDNDLIRIEEMKENYNQSGYSTDVLVMPDVTEEGNLSHKNYLLVKKK